MIEEKIDILRKILNIRIREELNKIKDDRSLRMNDEGFDKVRTRVKEVFNEVIDKYVVFEIKGDTQTRTVWAEIRINL